MQAGLSIDLLQVVDYLLVAMYSSAGYDDAIHEAHDAAVELFSEYTSGDMAKKDVLALLNKLGHMLVRETDRIPVKGLS